MDIHYFQSHFITLRTTYLRIEKDGHYSYLDIQLQSEIMESRPDVKASPIPYG